MADPITSAVAAAQGASTSTAKKASDRAMIAENFDAFLLLLTTQLKNQSPLYPMDTNQFTQQLARIGRVHRRRLRRYGGHRGRSIGPARKRQGRVDDQPSPRRAGQCHRYG